MPNEMSSTRVDFELRGLTDRADAKAEHFAAVDFERSGWIVSGFDELPAEDQDRRGRFDC
jgi:hypothetical protein